MSEIICEIGIQLGMSSKPPDHSVVSCTLPIVRNDPELDMDHSEISDRQNKPSVSRPKYNASIIPPTFGENVSFTSTILRLIQKMESIKMKQSEVDDIYDEFLIILHNEMDTHLAYKDISPGSKQSNKFKHKPYFDDTFKGLWRDSVKAERAFLKFKGN